MINTCNRENIFITGNAIAIASPPIAEEKRKNNKLHDKVHRKSIYKKKNPHTYNKGRDSK